MDIIERLTFDLKAAKYEIEHADAEIERLRARVRGLVMALDNQLGTPCEQIRHEQEVERLLRLLAMVLPYVPGSEEPGSSLRSAINKAIRGRTPTPGE